MAYHENSGKAVYGTASDRPLQGVRRFFSLMIERHLFGTVRLVRHWGRIGTNGQEKADRFIQTLLREWAYAISFNSSDARVADLARWPTWYNEHRPHGSLHKRTPAQALSGTT